MIGVRSLLGGRALRHSAGRRNPQPHRAGAARV